jgi:ABC-type multidrug transport system ATPase subunit
MNSVKIFLQVKKRVLLAKILTEREKLFLLDESFSGLDQELRLDLLNFLKKMSLERNHKILYVTHYMEEIAEKDYVYFVSGAKLIAQGTFGNLYKNPGVFEVGKFLGPYNHMIVEKKQIELITPFGTMLGKDTLEDGFYLMFFRKEDTLVSKKGTLKGSRGLKVFKQRFIHIIKKEHSVEACFLEEKDLEDNVFFDIELYHLWKI